MNPRVKNLKSFTHLFVVLIVINLLYSCSSDNKNNADKIIVKTPQDVDKIVTEEITKFLTTPLNDSTLVLNKDTLRTFKYFKPIYPEFKAFWTNKGKLSELGDTLFSIIKNARDYGLIPNDYHFKKLDTLTKLFYNKDEDNYDASAHAQAEMLLSDAYFKFGAHLNKGRFYPDSMLLEWNPKKLDSNWVEILTLGLKNKNIRAAYDSLEPVHEGYKLLKQELKKFVAQNAKIDWDSTSFYKPTDTLKWLSNLRQRLTVTGDYDSTIAGSDSIKLSAAIKHFQKSHNLEPDGKMGKYTRQALHRSKEQTIRQMEMALERWRWEPREFPKIYFWVNIPSADLHVFEKDKNGKDTLVVLSNVVVGKPETQTPTLKSKINYILIYPYWTVPYSIAWKEMLPVIKRDSSYLRRKNFDVINSKGEVLDPKKINWAKYNKDNLPFKFRQRIGDDNSLGICKFNFNNKYGVYLHDTNSKKYFKTFYRFQSHGCVRLDKYVDVARFLIRPDTLKLPYDTLTKYFETPEQRQISLRKPAPIYIKYYSAVADSTGLHIYNDIYRKDEKMIEMLYK